MNGLEKYGAKKITETMFHWFGDLTNDNVRLTIALLKILFGIVVNDLE